MTFGFSRDDVEGRMMAAYLEQGLLEGATRSRSSTPTASASSSASPSSGAGPTRPGLKVGVCGEHGGDPASIDFFATPVSTT